MLDEMASTFQALRGMLDGSGMGLATDLPIDAIAMSLDELRRRAAQTDRSPTERAIHLAQLGVFETGLGETTSTTPWITCAAPPSSLLSTTRGVPT